MTEAKKPYTVLFTIVLVVFWTAAANTAYSENVRWRGYEIAEQPEPPVNMFISAAVRVQEFFVGGPSDYYVVSLDGPMTAELKSQLTEVTNQPIQSFTENNGFIIKLSSSAKREIRLIEQVQYITVYLAEFRMSRALTSRALGDAGQSFEFDSDSPFDDSYQTQRKLAQQSWLRLFERLI